MDTRGIKAMSAERFKLMKKILLLCAALCGFTLTAHAQNPTIVTGCITDPNGIKYSGGSFQVQLVPTGGGQPSVNGIPISGSMGPSPLDANGCLPPIALYPNSVITPSGTKWQFTISNPGAPPPVGFGPVAFTAPPITIFGATQNITAQLDAVALILLQVGAAGAGVKSLNTETGNLTLTSTGGTITITNTSATTIDLETAAGAGTCAVPGGANNPLLYDTGTGCGDSQLLYALGAGVVPYLHTPTFTLAGNTYTAYLGYAPPYGVPGVQFNSTIAGVNYTAVLSAGSGSQAVGFGAENMATFALGGLNPNLLTLSDGTTAFQLLSGAGLLELGVSTVTVSPTGAFVAASITDNGFFQDSTGSVGTAGQFLSSTVTGTHWVTGSGGSGCTVPGTSGAPLYDTGTGCGDMVDFAYASSTLTINSGGLLTFAGTGKNNASEINGVTVTGTPTTGQVPTATSGTAATWQTPASGSGCTVPGTSGAPLYDTGTGCGDMADFAYASSTLTINSGGLLTFAGTGKNNASEINGVTVTGTPSVGWAPIATSATTATWQAVSTGTGCVIPGTSGALLYDTGTACADANWHYTSASGGTLTIGTTTFGTLAANAFSFGSTSTNNVGWNGTALLVNDSSSDQVAIQPNFIQVGQVGASSNGEVRFADSSTGATVGFSLTASATTGYIMNLPGTAPSGIEALECQTPVSGFSACIWGAISGSGTVASGTQYAFGEYLTSGTTISSGPTPPSVNGTYTCGYSVTASAAVAPTCSQVGLVIRAVTGTTSTDTVLYSDSNEIIDYQGSVAVAVALPTPTTLTNPHFYTTFENQTSGSATALTITATTLTFQSTGSTTLTVPQGQSCTIAVDPSTTVWDDFCHDLALTAGSGITITRGQFGPTLSASGSAGVSSFSGDGTLISNVTSTGAVTATLANAGAFKVFGNDTSSAAAPGYFLVSTLNGAPVDAKTASYSFTCATDRDGEVDFNISAAATLTLPQAGSTSCLLGNFFTIVRNTASSSAVLTVTATTSLFEPEAVASHTVLPGGGLLIYSDATSSTGNYHALDVPASFGGTNTQTSSYTATATDRNKLIIANCSSACAITLPAAPPNGSWTVQVISIGSTLATVGLNSLNFNGSATAPLLVTNETLSVFTDGTNYFGNVPASGGGSGANTALSNLSGVAINAALLPGTTNSIALGNSTHYWSNLFSTAIQCGIAGTTSCVITGAGSTSGTATITWPAVAGTTSNPLAFSNAIQLPAGTSSLPALTLDAGSDTGTGLAWVSAGSWGFYTSGNLAVGFQAFGTQLRPGIGYQWCTSSACSGDDTGLWRASAGLVEVSATGSTAGSNGGMKASYFQSGGTTFTASGCSNSTLVGGATAGKFTSGTTGTCTVTITMGNSDTATNGWACFANDLTTNTNLWSETATTTTSCTIQGTTVTSDVINFGAIAY